MANDIGLLFRGNQELRNSVALADTRLSKVAQALVNVGLNPHPVVFEESCASAVQKQLLGLDAVLVWVDPFTDSGDRTALDAILREVAGRGVKVSAHPDTILKIGTKQVLFDTREMSWGSNVRLYPDRATFRREFPMALAEGEPRVLKQYRGNGGNGVFKVELTRTEDTLPDGHTMVRTRHARRGSKVVTTSLAEFMDRCSPYFENGGRLIDQVWQPRLPEGMVRCYLVRDRVIGFGEQLVNALYPAALEQEPPLPGARLYYPPDRSDFQRLREKLEIEWVPELQRRMEVATTALPVIWDTDFMYGPKDASGQDTWVLCEINTSSVFPFPDTGLVPLAEEVRRWLND